LCAERRQAEEELSGCELDLSSDVPPLLMLCGTKQSAIDQLAADARERRYLKETSITGNIAPDSASFLECGARNRVPRPDDP
jgi:hypothetical protein